MPPNRFIVQAIVKVSDVLAYVIGQPSGLERWHAAFHYRIITVFIFS
jgi:hypothetical protein